jgi:hypothetical protein
MDKFEERSKRELLGGLRTILKALEPGGGFTLRQRGEVVNELQAAIVRREIAYLERVLPPRTRPGRSAPLT